MPEHNKELIERIENPLVKEHLGGAEAHMDGPNRAKLLEAADRSPEHAALAELADEIALHAANTTRLLGKMGVLEPAMVEPGYKKTGKGVTQEVGGWSLNLN